MLESGCKIHPPATLDHETDHIDQEFPPPPHPTNSIIEEDPPSPPPGPIMNHIGLDNLLVDQEDPPPSPDFDGDLPPPMPGLDEDPPPSGSDSDSDEDPLPLVPTRKMAPLCQGHSTPLLSTCS